MTSMKIMIAAIFLGIIVLVTTLFSIFKNDKN